MERQEFLTGWARSELLIERDLATRRLKLKFLVALLSVRLPPPLLSPHLQNLLEIRNFSAMFAIVAALSAPSINRLEKTFAALSKSERKSLAAAQEIISDQNNYHFLWSFQSRALTPNVPLIQMVRLNLLSSTQLHVVPERH